MKSKLTNRILAALCVAIVLSVLLALTSFAAEIKGGYGMIEGVDDTYKAASATINADGSALNINTANAIVLNADANKELAGLYAVSNDDFATKTFVYVYGYYSNRAKLGEISGGAPVAAKKGANGEQFIPGKLLGGNWFSTNSFVCDWSYYVASPKDLDQAIKTNNTAKATELRKESQDVIQGISYRYAYTADEIIPISEVTSMEFSRAKQNGAMNVTATASKLELYIADLEGNINVYTGYGNKYGVSANVMNSNSFETYSIQEIEGLPEEGYLIGYKYYPMGVTELENIVPDSGTTTISGHFSINIRVPHEVFAETYVIATPPGAEAPTGIIVEGTTFKGLDETKTYSVAPYTIAGILTEKSVSFSGVEEYDIRTAFTNAGGLYGIYVSGGNYFGDSDAILVYVYGKYEARADIIELTSDDKLLIKSGSSDFILGHVSHNTATYTGYGTYGCLADGHLAAEYSKQMWLARQAGDTAKAEQVFESIREQGHKYVYRYALTTEEIIPISDVNYYTFGILRQMGTYNLKNNTIRFDAMIMDAEGTVNTYTRYYKNQLLSTTEVLYKVDFESDEGWETPLPKDGYFVGYAVYPYWDIGSEQDLVFTISAPPESWYNTRCQFRHVPNGYSIDIPAAELPEGITVEGTVFKGLDATQKYLIAPYTILGADTANAITVEGVEEYDIKTAFATPGGLYGLAIPGDEYFTASKAVYVYISGPSAIRKALGTLTEKTYTWNSGADSKTIEVPTGTKVKESDKVWEVGSYLGSDYYFYNGGDHYSMKSDWLYYPTTSKALYEAELAGEDALKAEREKAQKVIQEISNRYAFTSDEIIPITEVFEMTFTRAAGTVDITVKNGAAKYVFMIMNPEDGSITEYVHIGEYKAFGGDINNSSRVEKLDIRELVKTGVLPSEGLLVGYKYYPLGVVNLEDITYKNQTGTGNQFAIDTRFPHAYFTGTYVIKEEAPTPVLKTFPVILNGYGEIGGLNPNFIHEVQYYDETTSTWSEWDEIDAGSTAFRVYNAGNYRVRIIETDNNLASQIAEVTVKTYTSDYKPYKSQILTMHLPNDFVELSAEYEMDVTVKNWVSSIALENIKSVAPESTIKILGDGYKFIVTAKNINLEGNKTHYFDMSVAFDGTSRFDKVYNNFKALAGEKLLKEVYFESTSALPFEEAEFVVFVGEDKTGADVELRSYNSRINKLRKVETSTVIDGWVTFTNYAMPYVILIKG